MRVAYIHHYNSKRDVINRAKSNDKQAINIIALELAFKIRDKRAVLIPVPSNSNLIEKLVKLVCRYTGNKYANILRKKTNFSNCLLRRKGLKPFSINQLLQLIETREKKKFNQVLLVDDVITSGNTVKACQMLINAKKINALIYASASRKKIT
jgi:predicted amidophosphoribosyltransferase